MVRQRPRRRGPNIARRSAGPVDSRVLSVGSRRFTLWQVAALALVAVWGVLGAARLSRLVGPPSPPPGQSYLPFIRFAEGLVPPAASYLYAQPTEFGGDTGVEPRIRYELFPRRYDDIRPHVTAEEALALVRREGAAFVLVPQADLFASGHWVRGQLPWFTRDVYRPSQYVLVVQPAP